MMWTDGQRDAIALSGNLIVSAAAGAGKTAVLTERLCRIVEDGVPVERLLVLTFTRAAAAEMKARIASRLSVAAEAAKSDSQRRYLAAQADDVGRANLTTIDAFCARVLRRHAHVLGLPPSFRAADETESAVIAAEVQNALLAELALKKDADLAALLPALGSEEKLLDALCRLNAFLDAQPAPEAWLEQAAARYDEPAFAQTLFSELIGGAHAEIHQHIAALTRAQDEIPPAWEGVFAALDADLLQLRALLCLSDYDTLREALSAFSFLTMRFPKGTEEADKTAVKRARQACKDALSALRGVFLFTAREETDSLAHAGTLVAALCRITAAYRAAFAEAKLKKGVVDFTDMEHFTLRLFSEPEIAAEYREKFIHIAVDEYQDSNRLQEAILERIRRADNLFVVGDVKQSIYRFRQAEPALFLEKLDSYTGADETGRRVDLMHNFRSASAILDAVNDTFSLLMDRSLGGVVYDERARLRAGADAPEGAASLHILSRDADDAPGADDADGDPDTDGDPGNGSDTDGDGEADGEALSTAQAEAVFIATTIRARMADTLCHDPALGPRPLRYGDFAILCRSTGAANEMAQTLALMGVPAFAQAGGGYFDSVEVLLMLNLLRVIDNRLQDIPLLSVMRSSIGGFTNEELILLRCQSRKGGFAEAVLAAAAAFENSALSDADVPLSDAAACGESAPADADAPLSDAMRAAKKAADFLRQLEDWRTQSLLVSVERLLGQLYDETNYYAEVGCLVGGAQRQANLDALLQKAHAFMAIGRRGIWHFLAYMDNAEKNARVGAAQTVAADVVRILSIHKSKGLEFPVVFLAQLGKKFNTDDLKKELLIDPVLGVGLRYIDPAQGVRRDTLARKAFLQRARREAVAEELRVLYVGMTRAREQLYLLGSLRDPERALAAAPLSVSPLHVLAASTPLAWLLMGARKHLPTSVHPCPQRLGARADGIRRIPEADPAMTSMLRARFLWTYPHAEATTLPTKTSVTRLGRALNAPEFAVPAFAAPEKPSAAERGTATHTAIAFLPLTPLDADATAAFLSSLVSRGLLSQRQADAVDRDTLLWLSRSPLFARMQKSPRVERELPFSFETGASELLSRQTHESILLQGVIDCAFVEDGAWVLVDYKTDFVPPQVSPEAHAARHAMQLSLYAEALSALTDMPVREKLLVLLTPRATVLLP